MFEGKSRVALQAADELAGQLATELLSIESPPMADWLKRSCRCGFTCWCGSAGGRN